MATPNNRVKIGWVWMTVYFVLLVLGCNHVYGYSLMDSFLNFTGIGSWAKEGDTGLHITSLIIVPLLLLSMIQTSRYLEVRYPGIFLTLFISSMLWNAIYPKLTEGVIRASELVIK
ncbi:hypothetical protein EJP77_18660 [Paenibacillus zeisoli]|uniref:Uncharacterized protein n=1 Tax=Paenibacillus zeisoli TaxID=2496267 RepID=A0A433X1P9_9BACL|nr:hypothetical protein [Paenibacillus zeisoli]RUT28038.1 hypothetical protein EJP77_18660 [Paenibacillus zeisoli]